MKFAVEVKPVWKERGYDTADFGTPKRAFLLRLRPGHSIHRHRDTGDTMTFHYVLTTNADCRNFWIDEDGEHSMHMEQGKVYRVDRTYEHWAVNNGETERVHLLVEY